jgi:hypothetical protein
MGFVKVIDIELAKVFRVHGDSHVGLVDGHTGARAATTSTAGTCTSRRRESRSSSPPRNSRTLR